MQACAKRSSSRSWIAFLSVLVLSVLILRTGSHPTDDSDHTKADKTLVAKVGDNVVVQCLVSKDTMISWYWKAKENSAYWIDIPRSHATKKSATSEVNKTALWLLTLHNATVEISGLYGCFIDDTEEPVHVTLVAIGSPPRKPTDMSCLTNGAVTQMTCCWTPGRSSHLSTNYTLYYIKQRTTFFDSFSIAASDPSEVSTAPCTLNTSRSNGASDSRSHACCVVPIESRGVNLAKDHPMKYVVVLEARNRLGFIRSIESHENPNTWVKTEPPINVNISNHGRTSKHRATALRVVWSEPPRVNSLMRLTYQVRYRVHRTLHPWQQEEGISDTVHVVTNLRRHTNYDVQVAAKPASGHSDVFNGFWSEWSELKSLYTTLDAPSTTFAFESIIATLLNSKTTVLLKLRWRPYGRQSEHSFYYRVTFEPGGKFNFTSRQTSDRRSLALNDTVDRVHVTGRYCNEAGCSAPDNHTVFLHRDVVFVLNVDSRLNHRNISVTWDVPSSDPEQICRVSLCQVEARRQNGFEAVRDSRHLAVRSREEEETSHCDEPVIDSEVPCSVGYLHAYSVHASPCFWYETRVMKVFRKGLQIVYVASGLNILAAYIPELPLVKDFEAIGHVKNYSAFSIDASWRLESDDWTHDDLYLSLAYALHSGSECDKQSCESPRPFQYQVVTSLQKMEVHENIYGGSNYSAIIGYCCPLNETSYCFAVSEPALVSTSVGTPEMPTEIKWKAVNSIKVTWSTPLHCNGRLVGYLVEYGRQNDDSSRVAFDTTNTSVLLPIDCSKSTDQDLYWVRVSAYNFAGVEKLVGPPISTTGLACKTSAPPLSSMDYVGLVMGLAICLLVVFLCMGICRCQRKRIKDAIRKKIWPRLPTPNVMVRFSAHETENSGPALDGAGDRVSKWNEDPSPMEVADHIHDTGTRSDRGQTRCDRRGRVVSCERNDVECKLEGDDRSRLLSDRSERSEASSHRFMRPSKRGEDSGLSSLFSSRTGASQANRPLLVSLPESPSSSESDHNPYSVVTPMSDGDHPNGSEMVDYPSVVGTSGSFSYAMEAQEGAGVSHGAGSAMNMSTVTGDSLPYVRYCQERQPNTGQAFSGLPSLDGHDVETGSGGTCVTYTKLVSDDLIADVDDLIDLPGTSDNNTICPSCFHHPDARNEVADNSASRDKQRRFSENRFSPCVRDGGHAVPHQCDSYISDYVGTSAAADYVALPETRTRSLPNNAACVAPGNLCEETQGGGSIDSIDCLYSKVRRNANDSPSVDRAPADADSSPGVVEMAGLSQRQPDYVTLDQALEMGGECSSVSDNVFHFATNGSEADDAFERRATQVPEESENDTNREAAASGDEDDEQLATERRPPANVAANGYITVAEATKISGLATGSNTAAD